MYELDREKFGAFVAQLRREKGCTQKELARQLLVSDKAVSKWETGTTIPDTALLMPLAELLGVTVTELLSARRIEPRQSLETAEVDGIVKSALSYAGQSGARAWSSAGEWRLLYILALLTGGCVALYMYLQGLLSPDTWVSLALSAIFGAYFCFFIRLRLPAWYDDNRISGVRDGAFRMNVPGLYFNNRNWPYIIRTGRIWSLSNLALYPPFSLACTLAAPELWSWAERYVMLAFVLGGLFIPMYITGKRHQ